MSNGTSIADHLHRARTAMANGDCEAALEGVNAALVLDPSNPETLVLATEIGELEERLRLESIEQSGPETATGTPSTPANNFDFHLTKAHRHLLERHFDLAMAEVTLALLVNPLAEDALHLEKEIQRTMGEHATDTSLRASASINSVLLVARRYLAREKFDEALEEVNAGLETDANHSELISLRDIIVEQKILKGKRELDARLRELLMHIRERFARTEFDGALQDVDSALLEFPGDHELFALKGEIESSYNKWKEMQLFERHTAGVQTHVTNARQFLTQSKLSEAAVEIALGLVLAPYHPELKKLEKELWDTQAKADELRRREDDERRKVQESVRLKMHLLAAEEFAKHGQFGKALDEIVQSYLIDPMDLEARHLETKVRQLMQRNNAAPLKLVYKSGLAANGQQ